jgi:GH24 family phage-related lysozyme (muramidase)
MQLNDYGTELVKAYERLRLVSYDDGFGYLTIGWGHTSDKQFTVQPNQSITVEKANELLNYDINQDAIPLLNRELLFEEELTDNQYSALVSLVFNSGSFKVKKEGKWIPSSLMIALNEKRFTDAGSLILTHDTYAAGKPSLGLRRRRLTESWLFTNYKTDELNPVEWAKFAKNESCKRLV